jgi:hypothetical protein
MKRNIMVLVLGSMLAVAGLAIGSDTAQMSASQCTGPCIPCPFPCATDNAAMATDGSCSSSCAMATAN